MHAGCRQPPENRALYDGLAYALLSARVADPTPAAVSIVAVGLTLVFFLIIECTVGLKIFTDR